jgi:hypothetical protein
MTPRNRGEPAGFAKLTAGMVAVAMRRANRKDLEQLKQLLERSARDPARWPPTRTGDRRDLALSVGHGQRAP